MPSESTPIADLDVLVVEDEAIISFLVEDMLRELGARNVWLAASVEAALSDLGRRHPHLAILDVNVAGTSVYPVAETLKGMEIPFMFASGYGHAGIQPPWTAVPAVQKPFDMDALDACLRRVLPKK